MASQDEHKVNNELGEELQNHQDEEVSTDERDRIAVVQWLRDNYTINSAGSVSKCEVYAHYLDMCRQKNVTFPMSRTFYGKLVRRAFPGIKSNRKGPRGQAKQHYTHLVRRTGQEDAVMGLMGSPAAGQRRSRSASLPSSPALSPSSMNSSGCLSFTFQVKPQRPRQRSSSCKTSSSSSSTSSSVQSSPMLSPIYTSTPSQLSTSTSTSPSPSACSSPRSSIHYSPLPSSPMPWPSTPQHQHTTTSQPSSPWPQYCDDNTTNNHYAAASSACSMTRSTSLSPYLDAVPMLEAPSVLSSEAEVLLYRCAMLRKVRERCREVQSMSVERPTRDSFLFRAINDPSWNDAWADMGFSEWCLDNLL